VLLGRLFIFSGDLLINFFEYFGDSWSRRPVDSLITLSHGRKDGSGDFGDSFSSGIFRFFCSFLYLVCVHRGLERILLMNTKVFELPFPSILTRPTEIDIETIFLANDKFFGFY